MTQHKLFICGGLLLLLAGFMVKMSLIWTAYHKELGVLTYIKVDSFEDNGFYTFIKTKRYSQIRVHGCVSLPASQTVPIYYCENGQYIKSGETRFYLDTIIIQEE